MFQLTALLGLTPSQAPAEVDACVTPPHLAALMPVGDGAALLKRRPDVRLADRRLAAATARIGVATAELYPRISLTGFYGGASADLTGLIAERGPRRGRRAQHQLDLPEHGRAAGQGAWGEGERGRRAGELRFHRAAGIEGSRAGPWRPTAPSCNTTRRSPTPRPRPSARWTWRTISSSPARPARWTC
ncbi:MAG: hypothetical protein WDM85_06810 [Caulobacteraceae bacterium]